MDREKQVREQIKELQEQLSRENLRKSSEENARTVAEMLRAEYDAFVEVGFTEEQAYEMVLEVIRSQGK